jgi:hypothetical protein
MSKQASAVTSPGMTMERAQELVEAYKALAQFTGVTAGLVSLCAWDAARYVALPAPKELIDSFLSAGYEHWAKRIKDLGGILP